MEWREGRARTHTHTHAHIRTRTQWGSDSRRGIDKVCDLPRFSSTQTDETSSSSIDLDRRRCQAKIKDHKSADYCHIVVESRDNIDGGRSRRHES